MRSEKVGPSSSKAPEAKKTDRSERGYGDALRAIYDGAAQEKIPDEMLDLLNKLA